MLAIVFQRDANPAARARIKHLFGADCAADDNRRFLIDRYLTIAPAIIKDISTAAGQPAATELYRIGEHVELDGATWTLSRFGWRRLVSP